MYCEDCQQDVDINSVAGSDEIVNVCKRCGESNVFKSHEEWKYQVAFRLHKLKCGNRGLRYAGRGGGLGFVGVIVSQLFASDPLPYLGLGIAVFFGVLGIISGYIVGYVIEMLFGTLE